MKKVLFSLVVLMIVAACQKPAPQNEETTAAAESNTLLEAEKTEGWELLFDGKTLDGWKRYGADTIGPLWNVRDGIIVCSGEGLGEGTKDVGGSLMTIKQFGNFELSVDWKVVAGGNSGILYHVNEKPEFKTDYATGPEYQLIDDAGYKDPLKEAQKSGSNYDMYAAPATKKLNPVGEWNTARIVYNNGHVEHYLNGEKTVEFDEGSADYQERYKKSKWIEYPGWNTFKTGSISLQDHGANVYFRNIKIKQL